MGLISRRSAKKIIIIATLLTLGVFIMQHTNTIYIKDITSEQLSANPEILNGKTLRDGRLDDLTIENVTLKNVKFYGLILSNATFKNVIFENCSFIGFYIYGSELEKVKFIGGEMYPSGDYRKDYMLKTTFDACGMKDIVFDNVTFNGASISGANGRNGIIKMINLKDFRFDHSNYPISFTVSNANIIVENCHVSNIDLINNMLPGDPNTLYITNSKFTNGSSWVGDVEALYVENSEIDSTFPNAKQAVVRNTKIKTAQLRAGTYYLVNNDYDASGKGVYGGRDGVNMFLIGNPGQNNRGRVTLSSGHVTISDFEATNTVFTIPYLGEDKYGAPVPEVNLRNVKIYGGDWSDLILQGGKWENVQIYPTVDLTNAIIENVQGYNVTFPEGNPWQGTPAGNASLTVSKTPFDWPEVHIPTKEELGFTRELPEITGRPPQ